MSKYTDYLPHTFYDLGKWAIRAGVFLGSYQAGWNVFGIVMAVPAVSAQLIASVCFGIAAVAIWTSIMEPMLSWCWGLAQGRQEASSTAQSMHQDGDPEQQKAPAVAHHVHTHLHHDKHHHCHHNDGTELTLRLETIKGETVSIPPKDLVTEATQTEEVTCQPAYQSHVKAQQVTLREKLKEMASSTATTEMTHEGQNHCKC